MMQATLRLKSISCLKQAQRVYSWNSEDNRLALYSRLLNTKAKKSFKQCNNYRNEIQFYVHNMSSTIAYDIELVHFSKALNIS